MFSFSPVSVIIFLSALRSFDLNARPFIWLHHFFFFFFWMRAATTTWTNRLCWNASLSSFASLSSWHTGYRIVFTDSLCRPFRHTNWFYTLETRAERIISETHCVWVSFTTVKIAYLMWPVILILLHWDIIMSIKYTLSLSLALIRLHYHPLSPEIYR